MDNKERYIQWVAQQDYIPVFMTPWWLDAVCAGKEWNVLLAEDEQGNIQGAMPYLLRKRAWYKYIIMPQQTQIGGIWVNSETTADRWATAEVCRKIKEQLDGMGLAYYYQQYLPGSLCVDAMRALGFKTRERVTYRVNDLSDLDGLIASFSKNKKRQLQKALSLHAERGKMDAEEFFRFHRHCMEVRKRKLSYSREFLLVLERKARRNGQCEILTVCNADGVPYAAAFLVWDKNYMYYLIPALDSTFSDSGAGALLALEAMKLAREKHVLFDFEGSMDRGTAKHYKQFGSIPVTYFSVEKYYKPLFRLAIWFQRLREWGMR
ncbi:MAG: GNAT family N-acetyltransferase [Paludibacteraceae bacterium]|nr:GNAT family N-acetyltransferase [Paludibacteraceae bacterium]MBQ9296095.1 GNAT family N-acetyltransferase [Paludibacteraceae bacterium]